MRFLVTGGTSGLGKEVVLALAQTQSEIVILGRSPKLFADLLKITGQDAKLTFASADFTNLQSVKSAVEQLRNQRFDGLFLNAGINSPTAKSTQQGFEPHYGVNVLAHELILRLLDGNLHESKVVVTTSNVQDPTYVYPRVLGIPLPQWRGPEDAAKDPRGLSSSLRYSNSKLASVLLTLSLQNRAKESGIRLSTAAFDPGLMMDTKLVRDFPRIVQPLYRSLEPFFRMTWKGVRPAKESAAMVVSYLQAEASNKFEYFEGAIKKSPPNPIALEPHLLRQYESETKNLLAAWT